MPKPTTPPSPFPVRQIGNVSVCAAREAEMLAYLAESIAAGAPIKLAFANAHFVNEAARDATFRAILPQLLILPDGIGVDIGSKLLYGTKFPANLNGTDFVPKFLMQHTGALRVALIGAKPGVAEKAAATLRAQALHHEISVLSHGYFTPAEETALLAKLAEAPADVLLVAFGNPAQEKWIAGKATPAHARLAIGVGALFDFLAGDVIRAPDGVRALRLEWAWRLAQEPARLWRRYILGNPAFLLRILRQKLSGGPRA